MKKFFTLVTISVSYALVVLAAIFLITGTSGCDSGDYPEQTTSTLPVNPSDQPGIPDSSGPPMPPISHSDLEKAAAAHMEITRINQDLQQAVQQTQDMDERQKLQLEANEHMVLAAEQAGLNFETYNYIMQHVRSDSRLELLFQEKLKALE
jgi:type IV secretory pathway VirB10-like protein